MVTLSFMHAWMQEYYGSRLVMVSSKEEESFLVNGMLWPGFLGNVYVGLTKAGKNNPTASSAWTWTDGSVLKASSMAR
jgi:hypothetical protein